MTHFETHLENIYTVLRSMNDSLATMAGIKEKKDNAPSIEVVNEIVANHSHDIGKILESILDNPEPNLIEKFQGLREIQKALLKGQI